MDEIDNTRDILRTHVWKAYNYSGMFPCGFLNSVKPYWDKMSDEERGRIYKELNLEIDEITDIMVRDYSHLKDELVKELFPACGWLKREGLKEKRIESYINSIKRGDKGIGRRHEK